MPASDSRSEYQEGAIRVTRETDHIIAVCVEGDVDLTNAGDLDAQIERALNGGNGLVVDFSDASFVDSTVIHVLVRAAQSAKVRNQTIVLQFGTAAIVERVLELFNIERVLPRADSRQEAVGIIQQQAPTV